ncbi:MAG TPA: hydrogenase expression protein HypE, partial [Hyphomicrobiales bacterium]|nr:hydrogenase expression protein HypE [Hyphomicrobiales bacterium]
SIIGIYDVSPSMQDRTVTTGIVRAELARQFAAGGHVGRASGRDFDSRRDMSYPPYDTLEFEVPIRSKGDVNARAWIRIEEVRQSISMIRQLLDRLAPGPLRIEKLPLRAGEGAALAEAFRGDVFITVRIDDEGKVAHCHARDASWFQWPLLEAAIEGNIVADFPLCNKSFNCSYSGHDI